MAGICPKSAPWSTYSNAHRDESFWMTPGKRSSVRPPPWLPAAASAIPPPPYQAVSPTATAATPVPLISCRRPISDGSCRAQRSSISLTSSTHPKVALAVHRPGLQSLLDNHLPRGGRERVGQECGQIVGDRVSGGLARLV